MSSNFDDEKVRIKKFNMFHWPWRPRPTRQIGQKITTSLDKGNTGSAAHAFAPHFTVNLHPDITDLPCARLGRSLCSPRGGQSSSWRWWDFQSLRELLKYATSSEKSNIGQVSLACHHKVFFRFRISDGFLTFVSLFTTCGHSHAGCGAVAACGRIEIGASESRKEKDLV